MHRNISSIFSHWGQNYELDRASWTTYRDFKDMYTDCHEMEVTVVPKLLDTPKWQDKEGKICKESEAYGCKFTHKLTHPE